MRQAAGIFNENLLDVMHREMMLVPGQPAALCIVEIPPVEVRQAMRNDQPLRTYPQASLVPRRKLIQEPTDGPVRGRKADDLADPAPDSNSVRTMQNSRRPQPYARPAA